MNIFKILTNWALILCLLLMTMVYAFSCASLSSIEKSMVQIWLPDAIKGDKEGEPIAYGLVVGDGSQILTAFSYEDNIPDDLLVGVPGEQKYHATIQAIDPQTSVTLLKVENVTFPATTAIAESSNLEPNTEITVLGWELTDFKKMDNRETPFRGYGTGLVIDVEEGPYMAYPGDLVIKDGKIFGILGNYYHAFVIMLGPVGLTGPVYDIHDAIKLLSPDAVKYSWANIPTYALITTKESLTGYAPDRPPSEKHFAMTAALESLFNTMGEPLPANELPAQYLSISWGGLESVDGTLLTVVYPRPIELKNASGEVLAKARWVGIQGGRSEDQPNRVLYGHFEQGNAIIDGGFKLLGDLTELENTLH